MMQEFKKTSLAGAEAELSALNAYLKVRDVKVHPLSQIIPKDGCVQLAMSRSAIIGEHKRFLETTLSSVF